MLCSVRSDNPSRADLRGDPLRLLPGRLCLVIRSSAHCHGEEFQRDRGADGHGVLDHVLCGVDGHANHGRVVGSVWTSRADHLEWSDHSDRSGIRFRVKNVSSGASGDLEGLMRERLGGSTIYRHSIADRIKSFTSETQ